MSELVVWLLTLVALGIAGAALARHVVEAVRS